MKPSLAAIAEKMDALEVCRRASELVEFRIATQGKNFKSF